MHKSRYLAAAALICFTLGVHAETVSMKLTAPPPGPTLGGVYISPYKAMIGPAGTNPLVTGVETEVICDDFVTEVTTSTATWDAVVTNVASLQGQSTANQSLKFVKDDAAQQALDYTVAAYLAVEIMQAKQQGNLAKQGALSFALWGLFDPSPLDGSWITGSALTSALNYLAAAKAAVTNLGLTPSSFANVKIYTPSPNQNASQEVLTVSMPEPGFLALLGLDLIAVAGLVRFARRRMASAV
jgi:hypothetical protein